MYGKTVFPIISIPFRHASSNFLSNWFGPVIVMECRFLSLIFVNVLDIVRLFRSPLGKWFIILLMQFWKDLSSLCGDSRSSFVKGGMILKVCMLLAFTRLFFKAAPYVGIAFDVAGCICILKSERFSYRGEAGEYT